METDWTELDARARAVLAAHDGIAHVSAFDAADISRRQLGALRGRGVVERPRVGWFVDPELPWQVKVSTRVGGPAACVTSAELRRLPVPPKSGRDVHVHVDAHTGRLRHNRDKKWVLESVHDDHEVRVHRGRLREPTESGRTGLLDTFLMLLGCVSAEWFVAALDAALHQPREGRPIMDRSTFAALVALVPKMLIDLVDPLSESPLETLLRLGMLARGITDSLRPYRTRHIASTSSFEVGSSSRPMAPPSTTRSGTAFAMPSCALWGTSCSGSPTTGS